MATRQHQPEPDLSVLEYGRLMDVIAAGLDAGQRVFATQALADRADLTDLQVNVALAHLEDKHEHFESHGDGSWRITSDLEA